MKKLLIAATAALCVGINPAIAQENAGGANSSNSASGKLSNPQVITAAVGVGLVAAMIANNRGGTTIVPPVVEPPGPDDCGEDEVLIDGVCVEIPDPDPECSGSDPLVDGVCIGTGTTLTVTGTGTNARTVEVNTTFTYLPTIPSA